MITFMERTMSTQRMHFMTNATLDFDVSIKTQPKEAPFNFDLERMKLAVTAPMHRVPTNLSTEELIAWMKSKKTKV